MVLKKSENIVKTMLSDTILALCKNTLPYEGEFCVEGLLGITLDNKEIFLVNINETIMKEEYAASLAKKRERDRSEEKVKDSEEGSSQESDSDSQGPSQAKRKRRKRRKSKEKEKPDMHMEAEVGDGTNHDQKSSEIESENENSRLSQDRTENDDESRQSMGDEQPEERLNVKTEISEDDEEDIVFVKSEPRDESFIQNFPNLAGSDAQSYGSADPALGLGQLQDLALQLSGDMSHSAPGNMIPSAQFSSFPGTPGGSSDQGTEGEFMDSLLAEDRPTSQRTTERSLNRMQDHLSALENPIMDPSLSQVTTKKNFVCEECGKIYTSMEGLMYHKAIVHDANPKFRCKVCSQPFMTKTLLLNHESGHFMKKLYKCNICQKSFMHNKNLKQHKLSQHASGPEGDGKEECRLCNKRIAKNNMARHLDGHSWPGRHQCTLCPKSYNTRSCLMKHIANHHMAANQ